MLARIRPVCALAIVELCSGFCGDVVHAWCCKTVCPAPVLLCPMSAVRLTNTVKNTTQLLHSHLEEWLPSRPRVFIVLGNFLVCQESCAQLRKILEVLEA